MRTLVRFRGLLELKLHAIALGALSAAIAIVALGPSSATAGAPVTLPDLKIFVPTDLISIGVDPGSGKRQLRFTHRTADVGSGPFEIDPTYDPRTGTSTFVQVIYNSSSPGTWSRDHTVPVAATGVWHPPSDYDFPLTRFTLNRVNADGSPGAVVATSPKTDYCITGDFRLDGVPNTPDETSPPQGNCSDPNKPLGWSVGWADQYDQTDAGQPIGLSGVADGTYILHAIVDPQHVFTERDTTNDVTDTKLRVAGNGVTVLSQSSVGSNLPTAYVTSPITGSNVSGQVKLSASASAYPPARIASVQFLLDGQPLGPPQTSAPYTYRWTIGSTRVGAHSLSVRATDTSGNMATASPVVVVVFRGPGAGVHVRSLRWHHGVLTFRASNVPRGARISLELKFAHRRSRTVSVAGGRAQIRTPRPALVVLRVRIGPRLLGSPLVANLARPPTVRIVNPTRGQTVSGTVPLVAGASDDVAVSSVRFLVDGKHIGRPVTAPPFAIRWRTAHVKRGRHRVSAVATDAAGNIATASVLVTVQNPAPPMTCFVMQARVNARGAGSVTTASIHTAMPAETLLAFVSADGPPGAGRQAATVSGAGLRWRLVTRANGSSGDSEIWSATAPRVLTAARVTSELADAPFNESLTVIAMEGSSGVGRAASASGPTGAASVALRTSSATSLVFAVGNDWDRAAPRTLPSGWVSLDQWLDTSTGDTFWSQYTNQSSGRAGSLVRAHVVAPTGDQWNLAAVELLGDNE